MAIIICPATIAACFYSHPTIMCKQKAMPRQHRVPARQHQMPQQKASVDNGKNI